MAKIDAFIPRYHPRGTDTRSPYAHDGYDGFAGHDPGDVLDWQMYGIALPELEGSGHQEMSDAEIADWDARVDSWAGAHGVRLAEEPAPEIRPWGYWMEIDGAMVWTDDVE